MPYLNYEQPAPPTHMCDVPKGPLPGVGTRWQCDECKAVWIVRKPWYNSLSWYLDKMSPSDSKKLFRWIGIPVIAVVGLTILIGIVGNLPR